MQSNLTSIHLFILILVIICIIIFYILYDKILIFDSDHDTTLISDSDYDKCEKYYVNNNNDNNNTLILQYENRPHIREKFSKLLDQNKLYADKHNYDYKLITNINDIISPYWLKVWYIKQYLPQYDYVVWIDSDAVIHDINRNITDFFTSPQHLMVIAPDPPPWHSKFMAGVFMIKRSNYTIELVNDWMSHYDPSKWNNHNGKWICSYASIGWFDIKCWWAGSEYEQGCFVELMKLDKYKWFIFRVPYYYFHAVDPDYNHDYVFSYHFAGDKYKNNVHKYITVS